MKDGLDAVKDVWGLVNTQDVRTLLGAGGAVWEDVKPANRGAIYSDIVINSIAITNTAFQAGIVNVNIYAPSVLRQQPDGSKQPMPDRVKLNAICKAITPLLDTRWMPTFHTDIEDPGTLLQDTDGSWFISIQLNYYSVQNNFKNI